MLTPEQFKVLEKQASSLYANLELQIIEEIATRIANVGYANTVALNNILLAQEMGYMYEEVVNLVAKYNNQTDEEIRRIFKKAGAQTLSFDDRIYKEAGLNPVPIQRSRSILQLMSATAEKTQYKLSNLVMTTANTSQTQFYNAMNKAYMEVGTGLKSYSQAIMDTIKELSSQGAVVEYPSGRKLNVESAVRMNIVTGVNQTCGKLQLLRAKELDWDLMELTAHAGARPNHAEWQGRIVSLSGKDGYLSLSDIGYGEVTGFKGINCNHDWMPFYKGSTRTYTNEELERMANEKVIYNGQEINRYEAMQMQRKMERQIRQDKKEIAGLQGILTSTTKDEKLIGKAKENLANVQIKSKQHNSELNNFLKQTKLRKDSTRVQIGKIGVTNNAKDDIITKENVFTKLGITEKNYIRNDTLQEKVAKMLKIDGLPRIVDSKEFETTKGQEIVRYIHANGKHSVEEVYQNSIKGDIRYSHYENKSQYGRGIYFGKKSIEDELEYTYGKGEGKAINAKIAENANILEFNSPISYIRETNERIKKLPEELRKLYDSERSLVYMLEGYDGIKINGKDYYCIYNRKVLIVKDE